MVSTRSGRKVEATTSDTQAAVDKPKRSSRRVGQKDSKEVHKDLPEHRSAPVEAEEDEDIAPASAFKVMSPVKVLTPRGGGLTADHTPAAQGSQKTISPAPQKLVSPAQQRVSSPALHGVSSPAEFKPTSPAQPPTRSLSVKDLVQEYSQIPLPGAGAEDDDNEAEYAPKQPRWAQRRSSGHGSTARWVLGLLTTTLLASVLVYTLPCRGWPVAVSTPAQLQPICAQLNLKVATAERGIQHWGSRIHTQTVAAMSTAQAKAQQTYRQTHNLWSTAVEHSRLQINALGLAVQAKLAHLQHAVTAGVAQLRNAANNAFKAAKQEHAAPTQAAVLPTHPTFNAVLPVAALSKLVQQEHGMYAHVADIYTHAVHQQHALHPKALGLLLACRASCAGLETGLLQATAQPDLLLRVDSSKYSAADSAGQLQQLLATFLLHNPSGVVAVRNLPTMHLNALAVLNNALSEGGSLQLRGQAVKTTTALFVVLWDDAPFADAPGQLEAAVKAQLHQVIADKGSGTGADDRDGDSQLASRLAGSFRRRLEYVLLEYAPTRHATQQMPTAAFSTAEQGAPAAAEAREAVAASLEPEAAAAARVEAAAGESAGGSCWRVPDLAEQAEADAAAEAAA